MDTVSVMFGALVGFALSPIFYLILAVLFIGLSSFVVYEKGSWSTFFTLIFGVAICAKFPAVFAFLSNPLYLGLTSLGYAVIGVLWARFKWSLFISKRFEEICIMRDKHLRGAGLTLEYIQSSSVTPEDLAEYIKHMRYQCSHTSSGPTILTLKELGACLAPKAADNKGSIVMWITYWPISMLWFAIADLVREFGLAIYRAVSSHFQGMADSKFEKL